VTDSAVSVQNRNNVLYCLDGVWTVACGSERCRDERAWSGKKCHCRFLPIEFRLRPYLAVSVGSLSGHCLISVGSHSGESDVVGTDLVVFYHAKVTNRTRIGLRTVESGQIRLETAESGRFLNNIWLLSWLNNCFTFFFNFPPRITGSWSDFWHIRTAVNIVNVWLLTSRL